MKKTALLFTILIFLSSLFAAETETPAEEAATPQPEKKEETLKDFYIVPVLGFFAGLSGWGLSLTANVDFRIKNSNIYLGFDTGFSSRITEFEDNMALDIKMMIPLRTNIAFGLPSANHPHVKFTAVWFSAGIDFIFYEDDDQNYGAAYALYADECGGYKFYIHPDIGMGVDLVFKHNVVLKLGIDYIFYVIPDLIMGIGYRF